MHDQYTDHSRWGTLLLVRTKQLAPSTEAKAIFHYRVEVTLPEYQWTDEDSPQAASLRHCCEINE